MGHDRSSPEIEILGYSKASNPPEIPIFGASIGVLGSNPHNSEACGMVQPRPVAAEESSACRRGNAITRSVLPRSLVEGSLLVYSIH